MNRYWLSSFFPRLVDLSHLLLRLLECYRSSGTLNWIGNVAFQDTNVCSECWMRIDKHLLVCEDGST